MKKKIPIVKIDTNVPIPSRMKYPFDKLDVNDSFVVPISKRSAVSSAALNYANRNGVKFVVRKVDEDNIRIWRTE